MAILDAQGPRVTVVSPKGDVDFTIEPGRGPGELQDPVAVVPLPPDDLIVVDRSAYLQFIALRDDDVREIERVRLPFRPSAACMLDSQLYVLGFMDWAYTASGGLPHGSRRSHTAGQPTRRLDWPAFGRRAHAHGGSRGGPSLLFAHAASHSARALQPGLRDELPP